MEGATRSITTTVFDNYVDMKNAFEKLTKTVENQGKKLEDQEKVLKEQINTIDILDQERKTNQIAMKRFENETTELKKKIEILSEKYGASQSKIKKLEACNEEERKQNKKLSDELQLANEEKKQKIVDNFQLKNENEGLNRKNEGLKGENEGLNKKIEGLKEENARESEIKKTLIEENKLMEKEIKDLTELNNNANEKNKELNAKIESLKTNAETFQKSLSEKVLIIQSLETRICKINQEKKEEIEKLTKEIKEKLTKEIEEKETENQKLKAAQTNFLKALTEKEFGNEIENLLREMKNTKKETDRLNAQLDKLNQDEGLKVLFLEILEIKMESQQDFKEWVSNYIKMVNGEKDESKTNNLETELSKLIKNQKFLNKFLEITESKNNNPEIFERWLSSYAKMIGGEKEIKKQSDEFKKLNLSRKFHDKFLEILGVEGDVNKFNEWVQSIIDMLEIKDLQKENIMKLFKKEDKVVSNQSMFDKAISLFNYIRSYLPI